MPLFLCIWYRTLFVLEYYYITSVHWHVSNGRSKLNCTVVRLTVKVGFHYPSSRAELTARELGCIF